MSYTIQLRSDTSANWATANPILALGEMGYATDTKVLKIGDGVTAWNASGGPSPLSVPAGVISQFAGAAAPSGYLLCQGQTLSTTTYSNLFSAIGYTYGGGGADFKVPDLQSRIPVGKGPDTEFDALGETGGAKTVAITEAQMPVHTHIQNSHTHSLPTNQYGPSVYSGSPSSPFGELNSGEGAVLSTFWAFNGSQGLRPMMPLTATNQNAGSGQAHNNLQPYIVVNYIIKT
jgi:microcystin-dependent protein